MEKNMGAVTRYEDITQRKIFRGQCFNLAATLIAGSFAGGDVKLVGVDALYDYAQALYDRGMERSWLNYGELPDKRTIDKVTGKVTEMPSSANGGGVPVTLTEKEGKEMDVDFPESKEDYETNNEVVI